MRGGLPRNASLPACLGGGRGRGTPPSPSASSPSSPGHAYEDGHSPFVVDTPGLVAKEVLIPITRPCLRADPGEVVGGSNAATGTIPQGICMLYRQK